jgi:hypothetical protein
MDLENVPQIRSPSNVQPHRNEYTSQLQETAVKLVSKCDSIITDASRNVGERNNLAISARMIVS